MNKENVVIIGAGQHCRVVLYNMTEQNLYHPACILDPNHSIWETRIESVYVEPNYKDHDAIFLKTMREKYATNKFFMGIGAMKLRKSLYNYLCSQGWEAVNIFHPNAVVSPTATIGKGVLVEAGCLVTPSPIIGNNVVVNTGSQVNHDNIIGDHVYIASGVILSGGVMIGENTLIDDGVIITLGKEVGKNCIIGAGAVVTKSIPDQSIAFGSPCKVIRENTNY